MSLKDNSIVVAQEQDDEVLHDEIYKAHVVCVVYDIASEDALDRVSSLSLNKGIIDLWTTVSTANFKCANLAFMLGWYFVCSILTCVCCGYTTV